MGAPGGVIRSEKWKHHKNSTHYKIRFYIIFIWIFFSTIHIEHFLKGGAGWGLVKFFFYISLYYFINVMIKTLYISNFIVYAIYFIHSLYYFVLMFFPSEKWQFFCKKLSSPTVFDQDCWNKHFIWNWKPYARAVVFFCSPSVSRKKIQNIKKYARKRKTL